jgi:hypothetical protein
MAETKEIKVYVAMGLVGCRRERTITVDADMTDDEIEDVARDTMFDIIEWGWCPVEESE